MIFVGYRLVPAPEDDRDLLQLLLQCAYVYEDTQLLMALQNVKQSDVQWVNSLGSFRLAYNMVSMVQNYP